MDEENQVKPRKKPVKRDATAIERGGGGEKTKIEKQTTIDGQRTAFIDWSDNGPIVSGVPAGSETR